jgi:hypothetical protein
LNATFGGPAEGRIQQGRFLVNGYLKDIIFLIQYRVSSNQHLFFLFHLVLKIRRVFETSS